MSTDANAALMTELIRSGIWLDGAMYWTRKGLMYFLNETTVLVAL